MEIILQRLCEGHLWPICITVMVMILLFAAGAGLRPILNGMIKRLSSADTEVNINLPTAEGKQHHSEDTGETMPDSNILKLLRESLTRDIDKVDKRVDTLWEHHEVLEKEMLARHEKLNADILAKHEDLKERIYGWKKEILNNQGIIINLLKGRDTT